MSFLHAYTIHTFSLPMDYEGDVIATLIGHPDNGKNKMAVLYIHGFVDYFYQTHAADRHLKEGWDFYGLELRKYGNSILPHQKPNNARRLEEYFEEITLAIQKLKQEKKYEVVILHGHSTGGLITSLYGQFGEAREWVDAFVLNSPFLAFNLSKTLVRSIIPLVARMGRKEPDREIHAPHSDVYVKSLHKDYKGEWDFKLCWKPLLGFPIYAGWVNAIYEAHGKIDNGLNIQQPILVLHSEKSCKYRTKWDDSVMYTDCVLNVEDIEKKSHLLGNRVDSIGIPNAVHDVFLSKEPFREVAFQTLFSWMDTFSK